MNISKEQLDLILNCCLNDCILRVNTKRKIRCTNDIGDFVNNWQKNELPTIEASETFSKLNLDDVRQRKI